MQTFSTRANAMRNARKNELSLIPALGEDGRWHLMPPTDDVATVDADAIEWQGMYGPVAPEAPVIVVKNPRKKMRFSTVERPCDVVRTYANENPTASRQDALQHLVPLGVDPTTVSVQFYKAPKRQAATAFLARQTG